EVVKEQCATQKEWQLFCLDIRGPLKYAATGMPGDIFWKSRLRDPIERFLNSESLFIDEDGTLRMVSQLLVVDDLILEIVGKDILEKATGRKFADRIIKEKLRATSLNIYNILHLPLVWDALREVPNKLVALYRRLVDLSSNDIKGRGGQDTPLAQIVFVLGDDKQLYPPGQITMFGTELDHIPGFLRALIPQGGRALHPEIAKDAEAVQQLKKCGVTVVDGENIRNLVRNLLDTITGTQQCPPGWNYPDDVIRATLFLAAVEHFQVRRLVAHSGTMEEPQHLFVPGSVLDWAPLWQANLLPGFQPVHEKYLDAGWLAANGLTEDGLKLYLKNLGVHGFENDKDKPLIEAAAEAIAMKKLGEQGHKLAKVTQRDKLGYDFECKDHCNKVFEVKGMSQPRDETLPQSETNAAQQRQNDYILVFAYNLPSRPNAVGYKVVTNPATIWEPVEIARIAKDKWLKA
ncbi:MAG: DUF3883 domain-containing protein, partial [Dehalococcoidia bacterium]|nr:DUF3883 domain-containing protein [Dehalococcoidia bacterium]